MPVKGKQQGGGESAEEATSSSHGQQPTVGAASGSRPRPFEIASFSALYVAFSTSRVISRSNFGRRLWSFHKNYRRKLFAFLYIFKYIFSKIRPLIMAPISGCASCAVSTVLIGLIFRQQPVPACTSPPLSLFPPSLSLSHTYDHPKVSA